MSKSCTILAHVRRPDGTIVESRLFNDLLHYTSGNRELSKEYYAVGTSEDFLSKVRDSEEFQTDENGEITFKSLRSLSKMDLETDKIIQVLNQDIGEGEYSYDEALRRIEEFNANNSWSDKMLATMVPSGRGKYFVSVVPKTRNVTSIEGKEEVEGNTLNEQQKLHNTVRNKELENRLIALLKSHGVAVKFLQGDEKGGRYSTENAVQMENGLYGLIEVNEKGTTTDTFAEEAGHFAIGALGDNPLVKRLENLLSDPTMQKEALGEEEYDSANLGRNPAREVAGRLVGKALQRKLDNGAPYKVLANRIANLAKRVFYGITGNEVRWAAAKAEQAANRIAYQFVEGSDKFSVQNAINIKETMLDSRLTINQKVYRDTMDELGRMVKRLEAISQDQFTGQMQASLAMSIVSGTDSVTGETALQVDANQMEARANALAFDGIVQALVQITDYLGPDKEIDQLLKAVNLENPSEFYQNMARNGRYLRQARTFLRSAEIIVDALGKVLDKNNLGGTIIMTNGSTIHDVKYQDENGTWKSIDMANVLVTYKNIIAAAKSELANLESAYFARFCEDVYGSKYITSTTGRLWSDIWHGEEALGEQSISIADMVDGEGMEDIDVMHRYLGSMSNNPDVIGQIADKLVKTANKTADDLTIKYQERLIVLKERADRLGLDVADLVEKDERGIPTGNMILPPAAPTQEGNREDDFIYEAYMNEINEGKVPYDEPQCINNGKWETERDEFKKEMWEKFKEENPDLQSLSGFTRGYKWDAFLRPAMKKWNDAHSLRVEVKDASGETLYTKWVPNFSYVYDAWDELKAKYPNKNGDSLERWMHDYRKIKEELDSMLPVGATVSWRLPQFRGTFMNSVRNSRPLEKGAFKTANAWRKTFGRRVILESFVETSEDYDYGDLHTMNSPDEELLGTRLNYEEERAQRLPVFGVNKMKNMNDLSTDLFHSMLSYAAMATSYQCLDNVVDGLEVGREALYNRELKGRDKSKEKGTRKLGNTFRSSSGKYETRETGGKNRAYGRYIKFLDKQVYGISATHWGIPIGKGKRVLLNKLVQNLSSLGGTLFLKGNVLGGAVNTLTGFFNIFKEAVTGDYFDSKDWSAAHWYYFKHFPEMWSTDLGELRKENKLSLFLDQMNAQNSNRERFRNWKTTRSRINNFYRMAGYLPYSSGDHYMQAMSYLSVAHGTKLYDTTDGKERTNLWNAYKKVANKDESNNFSAGSSLEFERFCPLNAGDITSETLSERGAFLKPVTKSTVDFEDWLIWQDPNFADETYRRNNPRLYNDFRDRYNALSTDELMKDKARKYKVLTSILQKTEDYLNSSSPLAAVPSFSTEEQLYLSSHNVGTGNYADILQTVKDDIYGTIWTKADESAYMDKCRETNIRLHGIYNEQDKTAWHQQWYTNAFLAMKGWALGYLEMMYSPNHYSIALGRDVEGFVNTAAKIPLSVIIGTFRGGKHMAWKDMLITMVAPWSKRSSRAMKEAGFSEEQNFNARRFVASELLMLALLVLRIATAKSGGDGDDDEEEDVATGLVHYLAMRTLFEQEAFLYLPEAFIQSGQLMDFMPVGGSAAFDMGKLAYEGVGAMVTPETDSNFYYQRDDKKGRYEKFDTKFEHHLERIVPYWKSWWAVQHPYEAAENYQFGRKLRTH